MNRLRRLSARDGSLQAVAIGGVLSGALLAVPYIHDRETPEAAIQLPAKPAPLFVAEAAPNPIVIPRPGLTQLSPAAVRPPTTKNIAPVSVRPSTPARQPRTRNERYVATFLPFALLVQKQHGVPAELTLAMSSHESNYGNSELTRNANNYFGIKAKQGGFGGWEGPIFGIPTREVLTRAQLIGYSVVSTVLRDDGRYDALVKDGFRQYDSAAESFLDYGDYLKTRGSLRAGDYYAGARGETNPVRFLQEILDDDDGPAGPQKRYATDPSYVELVSDRITEMRAARAALEL